MGERESKSSKGSLAGGARAVPPWFKRRGYRHFDTPIDVNSAVQLVQKFQQTPTHAFLPFISYEKVERRYKRPKREEGQPRPVGRVELKSRLIAYSAHGDSVILSYYAFLLQQEYEKRLVDEGLQDCVLAYRKFPRGLCNIHFARDAFRLIDGYQLDTAIGLDIEKFFDTLDHPLLKNAWADLMGTDVLPLDHYKVFRVLTTFAQVDRTKLYQLLGIGRRRAIRGSAPLCSPAQFREVVRGHDLIRRNSWEYGIPQGSPISAIASNLYMLPFDKAMKQFCDDREAVYRRYSDDILVLCRGRDQSEVESFTSVEIQKLRLNINPAKTVSARYDFGADGKLTTGRPLQYLGFIFDGTRVLIRSQSLARYHRRTIRAINQARNKAVDAAASGGSRKLRRRKIYSRASHLDREQNFPEYVFRSAKVTGDMAVRKQFKRHWPKLNQRLKEADEDE